MTNCVASPQAATAELTNFLELTNFMDFAELMNFAEFAKLVEKCQTHREVQTPRKKIKGLKPWERDELPEQSMLSMVWNISVGWLRLAAWLCSLPASAHLLVS